MYGDSQGIFIASTFPTGDIFTVTGWDIFKSQEQGRSGHVRLSGVIDHQTPDLVVLQNLGN